MGLKKEEPTTASVPVVKENIHAFQKHRSTVPQKLPSSARTQPDQPASAAKLLHQQAVERPRQSSKGNSNTRPPGFGPESDNHVAELRAAFTFQRYIDKPEHRGISVRQFERTFKFARDHCNKWRDLASVEVSPTGGQKLSVDSLNLFHLTSWVTMPLTVDRNCSFMEMLTCDEQPADWYVSFWHGELLRDMGRCLALHVKLRTMPERTNFYWVCAYSHRQHSPAPDKLSMSKQDQSMTIMRQTKGVLLILDNHGDPAGPAVALTRLWCMFEASVALMSNDAGLGCTLLDIASVSSGVAHLLTDGYTEADASKRGDDFAAQEKADRESKFPVEVIKAGLTFEIEHARTTEESERTQILNHLTLKDVKQPGFGWPIWDALI